MKYSAIFGILVALPSFVRAHTRWFADHNLPPYVTQEPTNLYLSAWGLIAAAILAVGAFFERRGYLQLEFFTPSAAHAFPRASSIFSMVAGAFFMIAGFNGYLFSPNLTVASGIEPWMINAQIIIGFLFLVGVYARVAAVAFAIVYLLSALTVGFVMSLENVWVLTTALFIVIMGNDYFSMVNFRAIGKYVQHLKPYALPLLRVGAGGTLLTLGFTEKILRPEFGVYFLEGHPWNFMSLFGFPFSDYLFTLSAGSVEALLGLCLILGILTRLTAMVIAIFFTIPLFILGPIELTGHLPHFAAIIMLVFFGGGHRLVLVRRHT